MTHTPPASRALLRAACLAALGLGALASAHAQTSWESLSAAQRSALAPMQQLWPSLDAQQQQQWLALARDFEHKSPAERATLHERMGEWARMTPEQRERARAGFGQARSVSEQEKRARWQQYQTLPAGERKRLGAQ